MVNGYAFPQHDLAVFGLHVYRDQIFVQRLKRGCISCGIEIDEVVVPKKYHAMCGCTG